MNLNSPSADPKRPLTPPLVFPDYEPQQEKWNFCCILRKCSSHYTLTPSWPNFTLLCLVFVCCFYVVDGCKYIDHLHGDITIDKRNATIYLGARGYCIDASTPAKLNFSCSDNDLSQLLSNNPIS